MSPEDPIDRVLERLDRIADTLGEIRDRGSDEASALLVGLSAEIVARLEIVSKAKPVRALQMVRQLINDLKTGSL